MNKYTTQSEFMRNLNTLIQGLIIGFKERLEYPANTIALLFVMSFNFTIYVFIFTISDNLFLNNLNWSIIDFSMFMLLTYFCNRFHYIFDARYLFRSLLQGELNIALTKPTNSFIFQNIKMINGQDIVVLPFLAIPIIYLLFNYSTNFILFFCLFILMCLYNMIIAQIIGSIGFSSKMVPLMLHGFDKQLLNVTRVFTPKVFEKSAIKNIIYVFYTSLMGFGLVEFLLNKSYILIYFQYSILVISGLILITVINWKIGLKKYEAYG